MVDGRNQLLVISKAEVNMSQMRRRKFSSDFSDGEVSEGASRHKR